MDFEKVIADSIVKNGQFCSENAANKDQISIGFGINAKYARPLGVTITSIAINNSELFLDFHIFATSIEQDDLDRLKKLRHSIYQYPYYHLYG